jgi:type II secretory pathway pseudopilin PulG
MRSIKKMFQSLNVRQKGFTLVEMVVYVGVAFLVLTVMVAFSWWLLQIGTQTKNNYAVIDNARRAMEIMVYEIKNSQSVYLPTTVLNNPLGQLSLRAKTDLIAHETDTDVDFFRCGDALCLKREGTAPQPITDNQVKISSLTFTRLVDSHGYESVQINLQLESTAKSNGQPLASINLTTSTCLNYY